MSETHPPKTQSEPPQIAPPTSDTELKPPGTQAEREDGGEHENKDEVDDIHDYQKLSKIGEGTYGVVYKARQRQNNILVALKKIRINMGQGVPATTVREIALLKEINHHNIIKMIDLIQKDTHVYLVFEYWKMDLRKYMAETGRKGMTPKHIKSFMHQIFNGLNYCHLHRILHRDLKPQNLLIDGNGKLTITDFGLSRAFGVPLRTYTHSVITLWYRAPEILLGSPHYSTAVDTWSVGCILAEMMMLQPIFPGDSQIDELFRIFRFLGTPTEDDWPGVSTLPDFNLTFPSWKPMSFKDAFGHLPDCVDISDTAYDLLNSLLVYDPIARRSAKRALEHPFFYDDIEMLKL